MKPRRDVSPYMASADMSVNVSLSLAKIRKRIRTINPAYKPCSRYQARLKNKRASRTKRFGVAKG